MSALLEFKNIRKAYGETIANDDISFQVQAGSIHALVGENGAGKSTLMKILFGLEKKDAGQIFLNSQLIELQSATEAKKLGLGMVHQHFLLAKPLSAEDHLILNEGSSPLNRADSRRRFQELSEQLGYHIPWKSPIGKLSVGTQQKIEILKLLDQKSDILIFDEPTAVLTPQETLEFLAQMKKLKASGKTILFITHKLKEVFAIADNVTVLRQGRAIQTLPLQETSADALSELMVGRKLNISLDRKALSAEKTYPSLQLNGIKVQYHHRTLLDYLELSVLPGEIVGIAGVEGNGQSELLQLITGLPDSQWQIFGTGTILDLNLLKSNNLDIRKNKVGILPEKRIEQGLLVEQGAFENYFLTHHFNKRFQKWGFILKNKFRRNLEKIFKQSDIRPLDFKRSLGKFSGGNQQKFVIARELTEETELLIAAHPTRGVDIGAIEYIHGELIALRNRGGAVLVISSDLDELMKLADRIYVFYEGRLSHSLLQKEFDEFKIGRMMAGDF